MSETKEAMYDLYVPSDDKLDVICYNGTWYIETGAGNIQTAREMLKKHGELMEHLRTCTVCLEDGIERCSEIDSLQWLLK